MSDWKKYFEGNYDKVDFKNVNTKDHMHQIAEDFFTANEIAKEVEKKFQEYLVSEKKREYLIDGAILKCSKSSLDPFTLQNGTEIELNIGALEDTNKRQQTVLHVVKEDGKMSVGKSLYATVLDCKKGELSELSGEVKEGEEVSYKANIYPFRCNCLAGADRAAEQEKIMANKEKCMRDGVCQYLMELNKTWENLPSNNKIFYEKRPVKVPIETMDGQEKEVYINATCITMTSMLFCKHGGLITPVWSGQTLVTDETGQKVLYGEDIDDDVRWLITIMDEANTYKGFVAVFYEVLNRCKRDGQSIQEVVSKQGEYEAYDKELHDKEFEQYTEEENLAKDAAIAVLRGMVPNPIGDCYYHFGKIEGYNLWCEERGCSCVIVIGQGPYRNVFYDFDSYGKLHNKQTQLTDDAIIIYDAKTGKWRYDDVVIWR